MEVRCMLLLFFAVFSSTIGSTVKATTEQSLQEMVRQLLAKIEEMEIEKLEWRIWRNDLSAKLQELQQWKLEQRSYVLERVTEMETRCAQTMASVEEKIQNTEGMLKITDKKVHSLEEQMERERLKTNSLQVQITELHSELHSVDIIQKNMTSKAENLRFQLNHSLTNLTRNMRTFENSTLEFLKDCANSSYVAELEENLKNLEKNAKNELSTLQSELSPRLEKLEGRCVHCDDVLEMRKTLTNHSSLLSRINQNLWEAENTCAGEPPSIQNGEPLKFDRKPKSVVQYECNQDFVLTGNSTVLCEYGKWEGHPPICSFFGTKFTLVSDLMRNRSITCYGDRYSQNIEFSRVVDTGTGGGLPKSRQEGAVLLFTNTSPLEVSGAYECRFHAVNRYAGIVVPYKQPGEMYFANKSEVANIGETVELRLRYFSKDIQKSELRWRHNGVLVPSWDGLTKVEISGVQPAHAGIYEIYEEGKRSARQDLFRLIVRKCKKNRYGGNCEQECPVCYNGGVCHDLFGVCICPIGFTGNNCKFACGENQVSGDCTRGCLKDDCMYQLFCKPDPFGCSCFPGLQNHWCNGRCHPGWYGAGCKQPCHCDGNCDRFSGACSGKCTPGWKGPSCQIKDVK